MSKRKHDIAEDVPCVKAGHTVEIDSVGPMVVLGGEQKPRRWFLYCNTCHRRLSDYANDVTTALTQAAEGKEYT